ncbi:MAG: DUF3348 family protein [Spongiibacter sp.]|nr:DUF3348 family protein [Spongiibacter sp.]
MSQLLPHHHTSPPSGGQRHTTLQAQLQALTGSAGALSHRDFADKLGQLIGLSNAIALSESLRSLKRLGPKGDAGAGSLHSELLTARGEILGFIVNSFVDEDSTEEGAPSLPFILPRPPTDSIDEPAEAYKAYQRFYALHQSEMDYRLIALRKHMQQVLTARSAALAQLAELDRSLTETLGDYSRRVLASIPRLLGQRFHALIRAQIEQDTALAPNEVFAQWVAAGGGLQQFLAEMRGLLIAELDMRLMPLIGLLEALDVEVENNND